MQRTFFGQHYALAVVAAITLDPDATVEQSGVEVKDFAEPAPNAISAAPMR